MACGNKLVNSMGHGSSRMPSKCKVVELFEVYERGRKNLFRRSPGRLRMRPIADKRFKQRTPKSILTPLHSRKVKPMREVTTKGCRNSTTGKKTKGKHARQEHPIRHRQQTTPYTGGLQPKLVAWDTLNVAAIAVPLPYTPWRLPQGTGSD